jgi:hypothetical protein
MYFMERPAFDLANDRARRTHDDEAQGIRGIARLAAQDIPQRDPADLQPLL